MVLTGFVSAEEVHSMRSAAAEILDDFRASPPSEISVFTCENQDKVMQMRYFLRSSSRVSCFLEEKDRQQVNKIGHALHELVPAFAKFSFAPRIGALAQRLGIERARLVQSMYILKNAAVGGEVTPHRDSTFVRGQDGRCLGYWWALEDATLNNGCLWAVPKSHLDNHTRVFKLDDTREAVEFEGEDAHTYALADYVVLPMRRGDLILLHGDVVHMSLENTSANSRHAYSIHVVSEDVTNDCWLQRPTHMPFKFIDGVPPSNDASSKNKSTAMGGCPPP